MQGPQIIKTKAGKFRVKYYGKNDEQLAVSEVLNTRANCRKNIKAMKDCVNSFEDKKITFYKGEPSQQVKDRINAMLL